MSETHGFIGHADAPMTWCVVPQPNTEHGYCGQSRDAAIHTAFASNEFRCKQCGRKVIMIAAPSQLNGTSWKHATNKKIVDKHKPHAIRTPHKEPSQ